MTTPVRDTVDQNADDEGSSRQPPARARRPDDVDCERHKHHKRSP